MLATIKSASSAAKTQEETMSKSTKQSQIELLQAQLADTQAQLEAERNTILSLETTISQYESSVKSATEKIVDFTVKTVEVVTEKNATIETLTENVEKTEGQRDRAVELATKLSGLLVQAAVYGTGV
jgi:septal ring factor EnvC (AmiA/AmiB activator)